MLTSATGTGLALGGVISGIFGMNVSPASPLFAPEDDGRMFLIVVCSIAGATIALFALFVGILYKGALWRMVGSSALALRRCLVACGLCGCATAQPQHRRVTPAAGQPGAGIGSLSPQRRARLPAFDDGSFERSRPARPMGGGPRTVKRMLSFRVRARPGRHAVLPGGVSLPLSAASSIEHTMVEDLVPAARPQAQPKEASIIRYWTADKVDSDSNPLHS